MKGPFLHICVAFAAALTARAEFSTIWSIGEVDNTTTGFSSESYAPEAYPGSATARDDHFYQAGDYPAPIGTVATDEPLANFEWAVTTNDPSVNLYFNLPDGYNRASTRLRITLRMIWGGANNVSEATHILGFDLNGTRFYTTEAYSEYVTFTTEVTASTGAVNGEEMVLSISRIGGDPEGWTAFDYVTIEADPTAEQDADSDNMPRYFEEEFHFDDNEASDAGIDHDQDGLVSYDEFLIGTDPRNPDSDDDGLKDGNESTFQAKPLVTDTDDDGLKDGEEVAAGSLPHLPDSDGDGASDSVEIATGFNPRDETSTPPSAGSLIGINFVSMYGETEGTLPANYTSGIIPQSNWNNTSALVQWGVADDAPLRTMDTSDIASPVASAIVDSAGNTLPVTITAEHNGADSTSNALNPKVRLFHGYLENRAADPSSVQLANIPFTNWDLYVYVGAGYTGPTVALTANGKTTSVRPLSRNPVDDYIEWQPTAGPHEPLANVIRFSDLTGATLDLTANYQDGACGIAAIQIVDTTVDSDGDTIPDWYELRYKTDASVANAAANTDGDQLTLLQEYHAGSNPNSADTDGDGLLDHTETNTGTYVDASNTGSNPNYADTDGDGLSDGAEVAGTYTHTTSPVDGDSDGDGQNDYAETRIGGDPNTSGPTAMPVPTVTSDQVTWQLDDLQIIWDHNAWVGLEWGGWNRLFWRWTIANTTASTNDALVIGLQGRASALTYLFHSNDNGGFSGEGNASDDVWLSDWEGSNDLSSALGFSGYGSYDISDPLTVSLVADRDDSDNLWDLTWTIRNQRTNQVVEQRVTNDSTPHPSLLDGTFQWEESSEFTLANGIEAYQSATPLEDLPKYANYKDSDDDGMPDVWETRYGLPINTADGHLNSDGDTLTNVQEYLAGTNPTETDSDNDGTNDSDEVISLSNPNSSPETLDIGQLFPYGGDLDQSGYSDAWEQMWNVQNLLPADDADLDGYTNSQEEKFGTNPYDSASAPSISISVVNGSDIKLDFSNLPSKTEVLMSTVDMEEPFELFNTTPTNDSGNWTATISSDDEQRFFRLEALDIDADSDGLSLFEEVWLGSSDAAEDSLHVSLPVDTDDNGESDATLPGDRYAYIQRMAELGVVENAGSLVDPGADEAARFLVQATFGPDLKAIEEVRELGIEGWLNDQMYQKPPTWHRTFIEEVEADFRGPRTKLHLYAYDEMNDFVHDSVSMSTFGRATVMGEDQLRQRVAFALSQIFVVSRRDANLVGHSMGLATYYDLFVEHAFGNYMDLLTDVTYHPAMGAYLSHIGNQPPAPEINRYPDENYAREVMQLFSIGLWKLNTDGSRQLDGGGLPIPTYSNAEITEMARVLTGFWYGQNNWGSGGWQSGDFVLPMDLHVDYHDFGRKELLDGFIIPKRAPTLENAKRDVADALRMLYEHPNTPIFISQQLIQFLVTDNPSPAYIQRIQDVFVDNGAGERGDLGAVVKAILMDPEARPASVSGSDYTGRLREPVIRNMHLARVMNLQRHEELVWWDWGDFSEAAFQAPLYSPSVFNFYRPDYQPPGILADGGKVGPVFQITNSFSAIAFPNRLWSVAAYGFDYHSNYEYPPDYGQAMLLTDNPAALVEYADLLICQGMMSAATKATIQASVETVPAYDAAGRVRVAIYLAAMSPEGAVQR